MVVIFLEFSKADLFLISNPCLADKADDLATTNGTARPKAWGQQITIYCYHSISIANAKDWPWLRDTNSKKVETPASICNTWSTNLASFVCQQLGF
jgi:hypothetical protein